MTSERREEMKKELTVGTKIYYTGDMANFESFGTITRVREANQYGGESVDIRYDDERFEGDEEKISRGVSILHFEGKEASRRFFTAEEWTAIRERKIAEMQERMKTVTAKGGRG